MRAAGLRCCGWKRRTADAAAAAGRTALDPARRGPGSKFEGLELGKHLLRFGQRRQRPVLAD
ncbi:hypothetical protein ACEV85_23790, partial [Vibrio parahaemolyticus]